MKRLETDGRYRTSVIELLGKDVEEAKQHLGQREFEIGELRERGFCLRVRKSSMIWCLRARLGPKQSIWRIGNAMQLEAKIARERASEARKLIERGIDPKHWLGEQEMGGPVVRTFTPADGWTWEEGVEAYLAEVKRTLAPATYKDYRIALNSADFGFLRTKLLKEVRPEDGKRLQDAVYERRVPHQARHALNAMRAFLTWAAERAGSGIEFSPVAGVKPRKLTRYERGEDGHVPTAAELGKLPWRLEAADIGPRSRLAALLVLLSVQRIETVTSAKKADFEPALDGALWRIGWRDMKGKRPHVVTIPPATWDVVQQAMALSGDSPFLFPQVRPRKKGGPCDGHISYHPVADPMHPLDPHDLRRGFATHGEHLLGFTEAHTKAILHHAEGRSGDVTRERYALHDGSHFKWDVMRRWEGWVLKLVGDHAPVPGARLRTLLPL